MLDFTELAGFDIDERTAKRIQRAANELLERQFLHAADRGAWRHYELLTAERYWQLFSAFFDMSGRTLVKNDQERWVGLIPDLDVIDPPKMRQAETILALMLALVYQESVNMGEVESGGVVESDTAALFERYAHVLGRERMRESELRDMLQEFKRRGIISVGERDEDTDDFLIYIRPMVKHVVSEDVMAALRRFSGEQEAELNAAEQVTGTEGEQPEESTTETDDNVDEDQAERGVA